MPMFLVPYCKTEQKPKFKILIKLLKYQTKHKKNYLHIADSSNYTQIRQSMNTDGGSLEYAVFSPMLPSFHNPLHQKTEQCASNN
jgi:hypothetical protein